MCERVGKSRDAEELISAAKIIYICSHTISWIMRNKGAEEGHTRIRERGKWKRRQRKRRRATDAADGPAGCCDCMKHSVH